MPRSSHNSASDGNASVAAASALRYAAVVVWADLASAASCSVRLSSSMGGIADAWDGCAGCASVVDRTGRPAAAIDSSTTAAARRALLPGRPNAADVVHEIPDVRVAHPLGVPFHVDRRAV